MTQRLYVISEADRDEILSQLPDEWTEVKSMFRPVAVPLVWDESDVECSLQFALEAVLCEAVSVTELVRLSTDKQERILLAARWATTPTDRQRLVREIFAEIASFDDECEPISLRVSEVAANVLHSRLNDAMDKAYLDPFCEED